MRFSVVLLALLAACSSSPSSQSPAPAAKRPGVDVLCLNDCLGNGGTKDFCDARCNY